MYHVFATITLAILLYLLSYYFHRSGYYSIQLHRKIWNTLLASAFLLTALAGIVLALKVNYKWKTPFTEALLKWHVEFGVGLAVTGFFHLLWHFSYYSGLFRRQAKERKKNNVHFKYDSGMGMNLFIVGFVSSSIQLLLLREMMNITGGYELISGAFLGSWLILSALGSVLAGKSEISDLKRINLTFSTGPLLSLLFLLLLSRLFTITGQTPSFLVSFLYTFIVLLPFCIISGFTFIRLVRITDFSAGKSFSVETAGGILAGVLVPILTAGTLNTYQLLLIMITMVITYTLLNFTVKTDSRKLLIKALACSFSIVVIIFNADILFRNLLLPGAGVTGTHDTPYGNVTTGEYAGAKSIYYNHRLLSYTDDVAEREEDVHYAMLQSENPERVILISGSLKSHIGEILKYPAKEITYIERDPFLATIEKISTDTIRTQVTISRDDPFRAIRKMKMPVDVILLLVPPPSTILLNRFYTVEFFGEARKKLRPGGIFMCTPGVSGNYYNSESAGMYSSIFNSLKTTFTNVLPIAGNKLYFIASDKELSASVTSLVRSRNIQNTYVGPDYLSDDLIETKTAEFLSIIDSATRKNTSDSPVAYFSHQSLIFSMNPGEKTPSIVLMSLIFALPAVLIRRRNIVMYSGASALAGFEIIQLITLQQNAGNMYQLTGILIAGLMAGLAAGAGTEFRRAGSFTLTTKGIVLIVFYFFTGIFFSHAAMIVSEFLLVAILLVLSFVPSFITGNIFRQLTEEKGKEFASGIYSADLAGSALGFILISSLSLPLLGIQTSLFMLSLVIFAGFLIGSVRSFK